MARAKAPAIAGAVGDILRRPGRTWGPEERAAVARWLWTEGLDWMLQTVDERLGEFDDLSVDVLRTFLGVDRTSVPEAAQPASANASRVPYERVVENYDPPDGRPTFLDYLERALRNHAGRAWQREARRVWPAAAPDSGLAARAPLAVSLDAPDRDGDGPDLSERLSVDLTGDTALPLFVREAGAFAGMMAVLLEAVEALPDGYREIVHFRYLTDPPLSHRQVAAELGITENNSRQRLKDALLRLRRTLVEFHPAERWQVFASPPETSEPLHFQ